MRTSIVLSLVLMAPISGFSQNAGDCAGDPPPIFNVRPDSDRVSFPTLTTHFKRISRIGNHYMPLHGDGDSMTERITDTDALERRSGSDGWRETSYLAHDALTGTAAWYRLSSSARADHMDSSLSTEASGAPHYYVLETTLGYAWTAPAAGLTAMARWFNNTGIFDHRTWRRYSSPGAGYTLEAVHDTANPNPRYGYERFGNLPCRNDVYVAGHHAADTLDNSTLKVEFNRIWGGAIRRIYFTPAGQQTPVQLVKDDDIGALVQSTIFRAAGQTAGGRTVFLNPTEAGTADQVNYQNIYRWAGSPVLSRSKPNSTTIETEVRPFTFDPGEFIGNSQLVPLLWNGRFKRRNSLGYTTASATYGDVLRMRFEAILDPGMPETFYSNGSPNMNNAHWLRMAAFGGVASYEAELYDVETDTATAVTEPRVLGGSLSISGTATRNKAIIAYKPDTSLAVGILSLRAIDIPSCSNDGKIASYIVAAKPGGSEDVLQMDTNNFHSLKTSAWANQEVFFVVGNRLTVRQRLSQIYDREQQLAVSGGYQCPSSF